MSLDHWKTVGRVPSTLDVDPAFSALITPKTAIVDLGCGEGRTLAGLTSVAGRVGDSDEPVWAGVDVNPAGLRAGRSRSLPHTAFVRGELTHLPFAAASFDYGVMHAVLTTLWTPEMRLAAVAEAARILRLGLSFSDFLLTPEEPLYLKRYEQGRGETGEWGTFRVMDGESYLYTAHHYTLEELREIFFRAGFPRLEMRGVKSRTRSGNVINGVAGLAWRF